MQGLMRKIILILFSLWLMNNTTFANKPKFSNQQIIAMTPGYFQKIKDGPQLLNATMYKHPQKGKVFQVEVRTNRNRENADLGASFDALLTLYKYFKRPPALFVVVLHSDSRGTPPVICTGDANCTADHFLYHRIPYEQWYNQCITFERSFLTDSD